MKFGIRMAVAFTALLVILTSCKALDTNVNTDNISDTVIQVVLRHDKYVIADEALSDAQETQFLAESFALRSTVVSTESIARGDLRIIAAGVLDRHDTYVSTDAELIDLERKTYLRSSRIIREVMSEPAVE